jgi:hypothetical protein
VTRVYVVMLGKHYMKNESRPRQRLITQGPQTSDDRSFVELRNRNQWAAQLFRDALVALSVTSEQTGGSYYDVLDALWVAPGRACQRVSLHARVAKRPPTEFWRGQGGRCCLINVDLLAARGSPRVASEILIHEEL